MLLNYIFMFTITHLQMNQISVLDNPEGVDVLLNK